MSCLGVVLNKKFWMSRFWSRRLGSRVSGLGSEGLVHIPDRLRLTLCQYIVLFYVFSFDCTFMWHVSVYVLCMWLSWRVSVQSWKRQRQTQEKLATLWLLHRWLLHFVTVLITLCDRWVWFLLSNNVVWFVWLLSQHESQAWTSQWRAVVL